MTKGFVLTLDAIMATTIAVAIVITIINMLSLTSVSYFDKQQLESIGNDFLAVMDLSGKFRSYIGQSANQVNQDLGQQLQLLPQTYCGNITVKIYRGNIGPPVTFTLENTYNNFTVGCIRKQEITKTKRIFINFDPQKFGLAELELWLR